VEGVAFDIEPEPIFGRETCFPPGAAVATAFRTKSGTALDRTDKRALDCSFKKSFESESCPKSKALIGTTLRVSEAAGFEAPVNTISGALTLPFPGVEIGLVIVSFASCEVVGS
jgi:hypothetical protein